MIILKEGVIDFYRGFKRDIFLNIVFFINLLGNWFIVEVFFGSVDKFD